MSKRQKIKIEWNRKQRRCFQRVITGLKVHKGQRLRFLTLTSSSISEFENLNYNFKKLKQRIRYHYKNFEYIKVKTQEANGVLHILFFGNYIPQKWLSNTWLELHQASIVDIRACKSDVRDARRLTNYVITQYVSGQDFERYSWSWGWAWRGFVKTWKAIKKRCESIHQAICEFDNYIYQKKYLVKEVRLRKSSLLDY
jgi:hypothetical protein